MSRQVVVDSASSWQARLRTDPGPGGAVYYFVSHPGMVAMARRVIEATLESTDTQLS